ncbi:hypothetical protein SD70_31770 [Gordoniibacillus kamchatkensis]|uniref:Uncharacterized protein n=1 Tax=Gordoniibacillus kamchatkensis TaxID=1590651 RepID=A0ABR5A781_9BACL|nr:hypothetical protein [Paenibacillus sp. VKM B-2647]KIL36267.1 hypothetical protein SD70_31770 [Paenibacillus sp. VKM B-2647]
MWLQLLSDNWRLIAGFAAGVLYVAAHRGIALSQAKKMAMTLMLGAEKRAEQLILVTGQDKFNWVIDKGYDLMPAWLRMFIGKPAFRKIVQELFDNTVRIAKQYVDERAAMRPGKMSPGTRAESGARQPAGAAFASGSAGTIGSAGPMADKESAGAAAATGPAGPGGNEVWTYARPNPAMPVVPAIPPHTAASEPAHTDEPGASAPSIVPSSDPSASASPEE